MKTFKELLIELDACSSAKEWAGDKNWQEVFNTCHRGDWLLWLFKKTNPNDKRMLTLAKGHCATTVIHLMKDERSKKAVDAAIAFGNGEIDDNELRSAYAADAAAAYADADAAYAAAYVAADAAAAVAADAAAAYAAAYAAADAAAAYAAADAAAYAADYATADDAADAAREKNQKETADICRKYLPIEVWNIKI